MGVMAKLWAWGYRKFSGQEEEQEAAQRRIKENREWMREKLKTGHYGYELYSPPQRLLSEREVRMMAMLVMKMQEVKKR